MWAPAARKTCRLRSNAHATVLSSPSRKVVAGTASRYDAKGAWLCTTVRTDRISCTSTASRTERVMAQAVSSVVDSGTAPVVGTSRAVFLKPTMPFSAAGIRIEPPVSEPSPTNAAPVATDTAAPDEEPPGIWGAWGLPTAVPVWASHAAGVPKCGLMPTPENANSTMLVRPSNTPPPARRRATAGASMDAAGASASASEPAGVGSPATSNRSFTLMARPASGWLKPWRAAALPSSASAASPRAASNRVWRQTCAQAGDSAMAMERPSSLLADVSPWRMAWRMLWRSGRVLRAGIKVCKQWIFCFSCCVYDATYQRYRRTGFARLLVSPPARGLARAKRSLGVNAYSGCYTLWVSPRGIRLRRKQTSKPVPIRCLQLQSCEEMLHKLQRRAGF